MVVSRETAKILLDPVIIVEVYPTTISYVRIQRVARLLLLLDCQEVRIFEIALRLEWRETVYPSI